MLSEILRRRRLTAEIVSEQFQPQKTFEKGQKVRALDDLTLGREKHVCKGQIYTVASSRGASEFVTVNCCQPHMDVDAGWYARDFEVVQELNLDLFWRMIRFMETLNV